MRHFARARACICVYLYIYIAVRCACSGVRGVPECSGESGDYTDGHCAGERWQCASVHALCTLQLRFKSP